MSKKKSVYLITAIAAMLLVSACGAKNTGNGITPPNQAESTNTAQNGSNNAGKNADNNTESGPDTQHQDTGADSSNTDQEILIIIDQTAKPIEGNAFDFGLSKVPQGYSLSEMKWISGETQIVNTVAEAAQHGQTGEDGFYISGNGQISGFFYPDKMKGEKGEVIFVFKNEQDKELTWKKEITLK
ncbi:hypothetical protein [Paenibacillus pinihumi]|uniref:hypothetical protein n=1 Tax=Paenibacillus pinihumi TaxID=669462 RepID=UPI0004191E85|nr:hypothetical protein [Paenibacillus pinihumi]